MNDTATAHTFASDDASALSTPPVRELPVRVQRGELIKLVDAEGHAFTVVEIERISHQLPRSLMQLLAGTSSGQGELFRIDGYRDDAVQTAVRYFASAEESASASENGFAAVLHQLGTSNDASLQTLLSLMSQAPASSTPDLAIRWPLIDLFAASDLVTVSDPIRGRDLPVSPMLRGELALRLADRQAGAHPNFFPGTDLRRTE